MGVERACACVRLRCGNHSVRATAWRCRRGRVQIPRRQRVIIHRAWDVFGPLAAYVPVRARVTCFCVRVLWRADSRVWLRFCLRWRRSLSSNKLASIRPGTFSNLTVLESLCVPAGVRRACGGKWCSVIIDTGSGRRDLSGNMLSSIEPDSFSNNTELKLLSVRALWLWYCFRLR